MPWRPAAAGDGIGFLGRQLLDGVSAPRRRCGALQSDWTDRDARSRPCPGVARTDTLLEELPLHRTTRERQRSDEVFARELRPSIPRLELAERGVIEGIARQTV